MQTSHQPSNSIQKKIIDSGSGDPRKDQQGIVSVFNTHGEAESMIKEMQRSGFDMKKISIIGRDFQTAENVVGFYNLGDRAKFWGKQGAFWGGIWGLLFGSAFLVVPGFGPLLVGGSFVASLVVALEGAAVMGGISAIGAALYSIGIPKNSILQYESELKAGKYVILVHGTAEDLKKANEVIQNTRATLVSTYGIGNSNLNTNTFVPH